MKNIDRFPNTLSALSAWRRASASETHRRFDEWLMMDADPRTALLGAAHEIVNAVWREEEVGDETRCAADRLEVALRYYETKEKEGGR